MGSGSRFKFSYVPEQFSLGFTLGRFPHSYCLYLHLGWFNLYFGVGKGYDEV